MVSGKKPIAKPELEPGKVGSKTALVDRTTIDNETGAIYEPVESMGRVKGQRLSREQEIDQAVALRLFISIKPDRVRGSGWRYVGADPEAGKDPMHVDSAWLDMEPGNFPQFRPLTSADIAASLGRIFTGATPEQLLIGDTGEYVRLTIRHDVLLACAAEWEKMQPQGRKK